MGLDDDDRNPYQFMVFVDDDQNPHEFIYVLTMMIGIPINLYRF